MTLHYMTSDMLQINNTYNINTPMTIKSTSLHPKNKVTVVHELYVIASASQDTSPVIDRYPTSKCCPILL